MSRAPNACDTSVSSPSITAMPKIANAMCMALPTPAALIACGPSGPTMMVSTTPMLIQPSSASTTGMASRNIGQNSRRMAGNMAGQENFHSSSIGPEPAMRTCIVAIVLVLSFGGRSRAVAEGEGGQLGNQPGSGFHTILSSAMRYVMNYEQQFALLVSEEHYVQELQRPPNPGDNLSRSNPGGGMRAGGAFNIQTIKSDFLLVQLGMEIGRAHV